MKENRIPNSPRAKVKRGSASLSARVKRKERLIEVLKHQAEGKGIRATAAALGVDPHTVIQDLRHYEELLDDTAKACGRRLRTKALPQFLELNDGIMKQFGVLKMRAGWDDAPGTPQQAPPLLIDEETGKPAKSQPKLVIGDTTAELCSLVKAWSNLQTTINKMFGVDLPEKVEVTGDGGKGLLAAAEKGPETYRLLQAMMQHGVGEASVTVRATPGPPQA